MEKKEGRQLKKEAQTVEKREVLKMQVEVGVEVGEEDL